MTIAIYRNRDLVPIVVDPAWVENIRVNLPELPDAPAEQTDDRLRIVTYDAGSITASRAMADYFDETVKQGADAKAAANWLMGDVSKHLNTSALDIAACPVTPEKLAGLLKLIDKGTISGKIAKTVFEEMWKSDTTPPAVVKEQGLLQISDEGEIVAIVEAVLAANPQSVADFKAGKDRAIGFLVGQIMKQTKGPC